MACTDAWGHVQDEAFGNGIVTFSDFDQASGLLQSREGGVGGGTGLIHAQADWDLNGNLTERQDLKLAPAVTETFHYDPLNRFDDSERNGATNADVTLDAIGNITWKLGVGNYAYHATQKRAVITAGSNTYGYDANGNLTSRNGASIGYTSYNLPSSIAAGSSSSTLSYGAFRNRYKQVAVSGGVTETTIYVAGLLEKVTRAGVTEYRHTIHGGAGPAALHTRISGGAASTTYVHTDHLGSPELITSSSGTEVVRPSFAAYGERRDGSDWSGAPSAGDLTTLGNLTRRGFTGHEHLDAVGLIHMNGRVYEPVAGRFLSRDPFIDGVASSQGPNGYAYVHNNPLSFTDPSGFCGRLYCWRRTDSGSNSTGGTPVGGGENSPVAWGPGLGGDGAAGPTGRPGTQTNTHAGINIDAITSKTGVKFGAGSASTVGGARGGYVDAIQAALDVASLGLDASVAGAPFSFIPDILNAGISLGRGDFTGAGLSTAAAIPFVGATGNVARLGRQAASSATQAARLSRQLASQEIAGGHAFIKHVIQRGEFPDIRTRAEFANMIENVMENASHVRNLSGGRTAFWRDGVVVIRNPSAVDGGTAFVPNGNGFDYFMNVLQ